MITAACGPTARVHSLVAACVCIRRACSPLDACGARQRSRFAERAQRSLNVAQQTRQKISRHENVLRLVTAYDRDVSPINLIFLDVLNANGFLT